MATVDLPHPAAMGPGSIISGPLDGMRPVGAPLMFAGTVTDERRGAIGRAVESMRSGEYHVIPDPRPGDLAIRVDDGVTSHGAEWLRIADGGNSITGPGLTVIAAAILPHVLAALRNHAPAEARGMTQAALEGGPGLDTLACHALADWLAERGMEGLSGQVRRLPAEDGDVMVLTWPDDASIAQKAVLRNNAASLEEHFAKCGNRVAVLCVPRSVAVRLLPARREGA